MDVTPLQPLQPAIPSRSLSDIQSIVSDASAYSVDKRASALLANGEKEDLSFETLKKIMIGAQVMTEADFDALAHVNLLQVLN